jgi:hypothetical protein
MNGFSMLKQAVHIETTAFWRDNEALHIKMGGKVEVWLHAFLLSPIDEGEWYASRSIRLLGKRLVEPENQSGHCE